MVNKKMFNYPSIKSMSHKKNIPHVIGARFTFINW